MSSFGWSVSDVLGLGQLALKVVQNSRRACGEHDELTREVTALHAVLQRLEEEISKPESPVNRRKDTSGEELQVIAKDCRKVLRVLDIILEKYNALDDKQRRGRRLWQKIRFGNGEINDLSDLRSKLLFYTSAITFYLNILNTGTLGRVEEQMNSTGGVVKEIQLAVNSITAQFMSRSSREGSILTTYSNDDKAVWKEFRRELIEEGFSSSDIRTHKRVIQAYVKELAARGLLDDEVSEVHETTAEAAHSPVATVDPERPLGLPAKESLACNPRAAPNPSEGSELRSPKAKSQFAFDIDHAPADPTSFGQHPATSGLKSPANTVDTLSTGDVTSDEGVVIGVDKVANTAIDGRSGYVELDHDEISSESEASDEALHASTADLQKLRIDGSPEHIVRDDENAEDLQADNRPAMENPEGNTPVKHESKCNDRGLDDLPEASRILIRRAEHILQFMKEFAAKFLIHSLVCPECHSVIYIYSYPRPRSKLSARCYCGYELFPPVSSRSDLFTISFMTEYDRVLKEYHYGDAENLLCHEANCQGRLTPSHITAGPLSRMESPSKNLRTHKHANAIVVYGKCPECKSLTCCMCRQAVSKCTAQDAAEACSTSAFFGVLWYER